MAARQQQQQPGTGCRSPPSLLLPHKHQTSTSTDYLFTVYSDKQKQTEKKAGVETDVGGQRRFLSSGQTLRVRADALLNSVMATAAVSVYNSAEMSAATFQ